MAGAHLDSVRKGPGINDNGSGVAALLEIATQLGSSLPVRNAVRFAFWGSEEDDLRGSTHYVKTLSRGDRDDILLYVNLDMIASPNAGYFVLGGEGKTPGKSGPPVRDGWHVSWSNSSRPRVSSRGRPNSIASPTTCSGSDAAAKTCFPVKIIGIDGRGRPSSFTGNGWALRAPAGGSAPSK